MFCVWASNPRSFRWGNSHYDINAVLSINIFTVEQRKNMAEAITLVMLTAKQWNLISRFSWALLQGICSAISNNSVTKKHTFHLSVGANAAATEPARSSYCYLTDHLRKAIIPSIKILLSLAQKTIWTAAASDVWVGITGSYLGMPLKVFLKGADLGSQYGSCEDRCESCERAAALQSETASFAFLSKHRCCSYGYPLHNSKYFHTAFRANGNTKCSLHKLR